MDYKHIIMKKISLIIIVPVVIAALQGCDKPFELDLPLSVSQRHISLTKDAGSTHILVYSDDRWTASLCPAVSWASLNKLSGEGNSDLVFSYSANYGIARRVGVLLSKGDLRDTVFLTQAGPVTLASYKFYKSSLDFSRAAGTLSVGVTSNLYYSTDALRVTASYTAEDGTVTDVPLTGEPAGEGSWILSARPMYDRLEFSVAENATSMERTAKLTVTIDDPSGRPLKSILNVTQTVSKPFFVLSAVSGTYDSSSQEIVVTSALNNIYPYTGNTTITLSEGSETWVGNVRLTEEGLAFRLSENTTGTMRSAKITVNFLAGSGETAKASFTIVQKA